MLRFLNTLDYMRMSLGILIVIDGYPLIFFLKETLKLAPGSTVFTALVLGMGFVLMVPFTFLRRLYRPQETATWMSLAFLGISILYMFVYNADPAVAKGIDMLYFLFAFIFFFLLINIPNDIVPHFVPMVIFFTLVSNMALVYALVTDPTWAVGQRAAIYYGSDDARGGNPHVFSRNAIMGAIACAVWLLRPQTGIIMRLVSMFAGVVNIAILVMTQTRSSILALLLMVALFLFFHVRPAQIRSAVRGLTRPFSLVVIAVVFVGISILIRRNYDAYAILYGYFYGFIERNLDNVYAVLGMKAQGATYHAALDDSSANRVTSTLFLNNVLVGHLGSLVLGAGYKFLYLDIPIVESLVNQGILGFVLFAGVNVLAFYYSLRAMQSNPNPTTTFLAYFYVLIFIQLFTNGRPYDISFWHPLALILRFVGVEHLFPDKLRNSPPISQSISVAGS